jgi:hypothetical protein
MIHEVVDEIITAIMFVVAVVLLCLAPNFF